MRLHGAWRRMRAGAAGLRAAARRAPGRLDPRPWLIRHRHADLLVAAAYIAVGALILLAVGELDATAILVGLPAVAFVLLVLIRAYKANVAQREEEIGEIAGARSMARQCAGSLGLISSSLSGSPGNYRAHLALNQLSSAIRLLVTRYHRYLDKSAVWAAMEAESLILGLELSRDGELAERLRAIGGQIDIIGDGIVDIDDPRLRAARGRI